MNGIFGVPFGTLGPALASGMPGSMMVPLLWVTVLVWAAVAVLLAAVAGIVSARERKQPASRGCVGVPSRGATLRLCPGCVH